MSFVISVCPSCLSVPPSVRLHGITRLPLNKFLPNFIYDYFSKIYRESSRLIKSESSRLIKSDKNNGHFTCKPINVFDLISLSSSWNEKHWRQKFLEKIENTFHVCNFFFLEDSIIYEIMWKNIVERDRPQMAI
jgi:hypothetical protein